MSGAGPKGGTRGPTISIPRPGGVARPPPPHDDHAARAEPSRLPPREPGREPAPPRAPPGIPPIGENRLLDVAGPLLALLRQLGAMPECRDPEGLLRRATEAVRRFEADARSADIASEDVQLARYVLCTVIDEAVMALPWGADSLWSRQGLLSTFFDDIQGGQRFFEILDRLGHNPARNIELLELMHVCLRLGFRGRYRLGQGGNRTLEEIGRNLFAVIRRERGTPDEELSPAWRPLAAPRRRFAQAVPVWVVGAGATAFLAVLFTVLSFGLGRETEAVARQVAGLGAEIAMPRPVELRGEPVRQAVADDLPGLLRPEVEAGRLRILDRGTVLRIQTVGLDLFASGSDQLRNANLPLFHHIAAALKDRPGPVLVTGHTDGVPIARSLAFPSNDALSLGRARAVARLLEDRTGGAPRILAEGRADREPIAGEDTAAGRQANRRVEIDVPKRRPPGGGR